MPRVLRCCTLPLPENTVRVSSVRCCLRFAQKVESSGLAPGAVLPKDNAKNFSPAYHQDPNQVWHQLYKGSAYCYMSHLMRMTVVHREISKRRCTFIRLPLREYMLRDECQVLGYNILLALLDFDQKGDLS